ncbi:MAG: IS607 family transposase [Candidatus Dormibacteria bacterium]
MARITGWATGEGLSVRRVVTEVGSAPNRKRRKVLTLLRDESVAVIVVEHRDRSACFGAGYVEAALSGQGRRQLVVDPAEVRTEPGNGRGTSRLGATSSGVTRVHTMATVQGRT